MKLRVKKEKGISREGRYGREGRKQTLADFASQRATTLRLRGQGSGGVRSTYRQLSNIKGSGGVRSTYRQLSNIMHLPSVAHVRHDDVWF